MNVGNIRHKGIISATLTLAAIFCVLYASYFATLVPGINPLILITILRKTSVLLISKLKLREMK